MIERYRTDEEEAHDRGQQWHRWEREGTDHETVGAMYTWRRFRKLTPAHAARLEAFVAGSMADLRAALAEQAKGPTKP